MKEVPEKLIAKHKDNVDAIYADQAFKEDTEFEYPDEKTVVKEWDAGRKAITTRNLSKKFRALFSEDGLDLDYKIDFYRVAENLQLLSNVDALGDESNTVEVHVRVDGRYPVAVKLTDKLWYVIAPMYDKEGGR